MQDQDQPNPDDNSNSVADEVVGTVKALLLAIGGVALLLSIWVILPMALTYLTEGDYRAPSEIHPTDTASKNNPNNYNNYNLEKPNQ